MVQMGRGPRALGRRLLAEDVAPLLLPVAQRVPRLVADYSCHPGVPLFDLLSAELPRLLERRQQALLHHVGDVLLLRVPPAEQAEGHLFQLRAVGLGQLPVGRLVAGAGRG